MTVDGTGVTVNHVDGQRAVPASNLAAPSGSKERLRADAVRNAAQIREAAVAAFHGRGLATPLEVIAAAAGVSKGTIYARFGGRDGLIDAAIGELVAARLYAMIDRTQQGDDLWQTVSTYVSDRRELQYEEPAFTDALLLAYPNSAQLVALARRATEATVALLTRARAAGAVRADFTADDLYYADIANGLALRAGPRPSREDYDRRTRFFLDSLRPR